MNYGKGVRGSLVECGENVRNLVRRRADERMVLPI